MLRWFGGGGDPSGWKVRDGFMEDVVSAWALKETEESIPGGKDIPEDENSETKGTETGKPGASFRNDNGCRVQRENRALCL